MSTQVDGSAVGAAAHFGEDGHDATEESEGVLRLAEDATQDIVDEAQQRHQTDGENRRVVIRHLGVIRPTHSHLLVRPCAYDFHHD